MAKKITQTTKKKSESPPLFSKITDENINEIYALVKDNLHPGDVYIYIHKKI